MQKSINKKGLTLLEILISALILAIVMVGLANIFVAGKRFIVLPRSRIQAAELGRLFLAPLQMQVRQDTWNNSANLLYIPAGSNSTTFSGANISLNNVNYTSLYNVSRIFYGNGTDSGLRRVNVRVLWNETAP